MALIFRVSCVLLLFGGIVHCDEGGFDPYNTLGVNRRSSSDDIRKSYKKLAREW